MPVQILQNFRKKYPQYNDLDDSTIADRLAKKYPKAYSELPNLVVQDISPTNKPRLTNAEQFNPDGAGYDYESAKKYGIEPDETGHYPSRVSETGQILKGKQHPTFNKTIQGEEKLGYKIAKNDKDGRYYSYKEPAVPTPIPDITALDNFMAPPEVKQPGQEQFEGLTKNGIPEDVAGYMALKNILEPIQKGVPKEMTDPQRVIPKEENLNPRAIIGQKVIEGLKNAVTSFGEGGRRTLQGVKGLLDDPTDLGSYGETAVGGLETGISAIPGVVGLNIVSPSVDMAARSFAKNFNLDEEKASGIVQRALPFVFGKWVGVGSLSAEAITEGIKDSGVLNGLNYQDQKTVNDLIHNAVFFAVAMGGKKTAEATRDAVARKTYKPVVKDITSAEMKAETGLTREGEQIFRDRLNDPALSANEKQTTLDFLKRKGITPESLGANAEVIRKPIGVIPEKNILPGEEKIFTEKPKVEKTKTQQAGDVLKIENPEVLKEFGELPKFDRVSTEKELSLTGLKELDDLTIQKISENKNVVEKILDLKDYRKTEKAASTLREIKKEVDNLRSQGISASYENEQLKINGKKVYPYTTTQPIQLDKIEIEPTEAKTPFKKLPANEVDRQTLMAQMFADKRVLTPELNRLLPEGFGQKKLEKGTQDIIDDAGKEQSKEAQIVRDFVKAVETEFQQQGGIKLKDNNTITRDDLEEMIDGYSAERDKTFEEGDTSFEFGENVRKESEVRSQKSEEQYNEVEKTNTEKKYRNFIERALQRDIDESKGQEILDQLTNDKVSPQSVANKFWKETYSNLDDNQKLNFQKMILKNRGVEVAKTDAEIIQQGLEMADYGNDAEYLEGTERGDIALMAVANDLVTKNNNKKLELPEPTTKTKPTTERTAAGDQFTFGKEVKPSFPTKAMYEGKADRSEETPLFSQPKEDKAQESLFEGKKEITELENKLNAIARKFDLVTSEKMTEKLTTEYNKIEAELSKLKDKNIDNKKEEAFGFKLIDKDGNEFIPIKKEGNQYRALDKDGKEVIRNIKDPQYPNREGDKIVRDFSQNDKTIEEIINSKIGQKPSRQSSSENDIEEFSEKVSLNDYIDKTIEEVSKSEKLRKQKDIVATDKFSSSLPGVNIFEKIFSSQPAQNIKTPTGNTKFDNQFKLRQNDFFESKRSKMSKAFQELKSAMTYLEKIKKDETLSKSQKDYITREIDVLRKDLTANIRDKRNKILYAVFGDIEGDTASIQKRVADLGQFASAKRLEAIYSDPELVDKQINLGYTKEEAKAIVESLQNDLPKEVLRSYDRMRKILDDYGEFLALEGIVEKTTDNYFPFKVLEFINDFGLATGQKRVQKIIPGSSKQFKGTGKEYDIDALSILSEYFTQNERARAYNKFEKNVVEKFHNADKIDENNKPLPGYDEYYFDPRRVFFKMFAVTETQLNKLLREPDLFEDAGNIQSVVREIFAMGRKKGKRYIIPKGLAETLYDVYGNVLPKNIPYISNATQWWKRNMVGRIGLFINMYHARNMRTDVSKVFNIHPQSFQYLPEVENFLRTKTNVPQKVWLATIDLVGMKTPIKKAMRLGKKKRLLTNNELQKYWDEGIEADTFQGQIWTEGLGISERELKTKFMKDSVKRRFGEVKEAIGITSVLDKFDDVARLREAKLRFATYSYLRGIKGLSKEAAHEEVGKTLINYNHFTPFEKKWFVNGFIPFYSFRKGNLETTIQQFKEGNKRQRAFIIGTMLTSTLGVSLYNYLYAPDDEEKLQNDPNKKYIADNFHLATPYFDDNGNRIYLYDQNWNDDISRIFNINGGIATARKVINNQLSVPEAIGEFGWNLTKGNFDDIIQNMTPLLSTPFEYATNRNFYYGFPIYKEDDPALEKFTKSLLYGSGVASRNFSTMRGLLVGRQDATMKGLRLSGLPITSVDLSRSENNFEAFNDRLLKEKLQEIRDVEKDLRLLKAEAIKTNDYNSDKSKLYRQTKDQLDQMKEDSDAWQQKLELQKEKRNKEKEILGTDNKRTTRRAGR